MKNSNAAQGHEQRAPSRKEQEDGTTNSPHTSKFNKQGPDIRGHKESVKKGPTTHSNIRGKKSKIQKHQTLTTGRNIGDTIHSKEEEGPSTHHGVNHGKNPVIRSKTWKHIKTTKNRTANKRTMERGHKTKIS